MTKNHGLTPLEKCQIFAFLKSTFCWYKIDSFPPRTSQTTFFRTILLTKKQKLSYFSPKIRKKGKNFLMLDEKSWTNPFKKIQNFFLRLKWLDFYRQGHKTLCSGLFCWKTKKGQNFQFSPFLNRYIFSLKWLDFYLQAHKTLCFELFCQKTKQEHSFLFLTKNHRLTPLEKCQFSTF